MDLGRDVAQEICDSLTGCFTELRKSIETHEIAMKALATELENLKHQQNDIIRRLNAEDFEIHMNDITVDE